MSFGICVLAAMVPPNPRLLLSGVLSASAAAGYVCWNGWRQLRQAPAAEVQSVRWTWTEYCSGPSQYPL